jgi:putative ABC transport system permease protein
MLKKLNPKQRPLAWAQLSHQKVRLAVAMGGIAFANILIFMQLGFRALFTEGATILPQSISGNLFLINTQTEYIGASNFDRIRLYQAASVSGVARTTPLYIGMGAWSYGKDNINFGARVFAFNPRQTVFNLPEINAQRPQLDSPNAVLFDRRSKSTFGPIAQQVEQQQQVLALLNNRRVSAVGLFDMGNSFFLGEGNVVMSESTYAEIFGETVLNQVGVGVITLEPGANPEAVKATIKATVPGVEVLTHQELIGKELKFQESNPTGPIFGFGTMMGFIVGIVIVYQVLYADVNDHLSEYATLKAMGYSDVALLRVIFLEAGILAVLGFVPGFGLSVWMYGFLSQVTRLDLIMTPDIAITVMILTIVMCMVSAAIASGKLRSADPADVF